MKPSEVAFMSQSSRSKLIGEIAAVVRTPLAPPEARQAGLTLIGWLARRMPGDSVDDKTLR